MEQIIEAICVRAPTSPAIFDLQVSERHLQQKYSKERDAPRYRPKCRQCPRYERGSQVSSTECDQFTVGTDAISIQSGVLLGGNDAIEESDDDTNTGKRPLVLMAV